MSNCNIQPVGNVWTTYGDLEFGRLALQQAIERDPYGEGLPIVTEKALLAYAKDIGIANPIIPSYPSTRYPAAVLRFSKEMLHFLDSLIPKYRKVLRNQWGLQWRLLDTVFCKTTVRLMAEGHECIESFEKAALAFIDKPERMSNRQVLGRLWQLLEKNRHNEHWYREKLLAHYLGKQKSASAIAEFVIQDDDVGQSWLDLAIFSSGATLFEIKTDLDSPARLKRQLPWYRQLFTKICLAVTQRNLAKIRKVAQDLAPCAGLVMVEDNGTIVPVKEPIEDTSKLQIATIHRFLRSKEVENILRHTYNKTSCAQINDIDCYPERRRLLTEIGTIRLQRMAMELIAKRGSAGNEAFSLAPKGLKECAYFLQLRHGRKLNLDVFLNFLEKPFSVHSNLWSQHWT